MVSAKNIIDMSLLCAVQAWSVRSAGTSQRVVLRGQAKYGEMTFS